MLKTRSIVFAIILSLITCGLYAFYWMGSLTNTVNRLSNNENALSGFWCVLWTVVTGGLFGLYWAYTMGDRSDTFKGNRNGYGGILHLILFLLGFGTINLILLQHDVNRQIEG